MKRIIILELDTPRIFRAALWADVPVARQPFYANVNATSAYKDATAAELTAIRTGAVAEKVDKFYCPAGSTLAQAQAFMQLEWQKWQDEITNSNPWSAYGRFWDGATWTPGGVA